MGLLPTIGARSALGCTSACNPLPPPLELDPFFAVAIIFLRSFFGLSRRVTQRSNECSLFMITAMGARSYGFMVFHTHRRFSSPRLPSPEYGTFASICRVLARPLPL